MADFNVRALEANLDFDKLPYWDVVIIGAGPAGLAAGLTTAHRALTTLIIEAITSPYWLNEKRLRDNKIALIGDKISKAARARKRLA
jgi:thioredoxin reductase